MSKKTLKTARGKRKRPAAPYAPETFAPPETSNNSIRNIANYLTEQISLMGMSVIVSCSRVSKSQYLCVNARERRYTIRISDHAFRHNKKKHDFNVYGNTPYEKAYHYLDFMEKFREIIGEGCDELKLANPSKIEEM